EPDTANRFRRNCQTNTRAVKRRLNLAMKRQVVQPCGVITRGSRPPPDHRGCDETVPEAATVRVNAIGTNTCTCSAAAETSTVTASGAPRGRSAHKPGIEVRT